MAIYMDSSSMRVRRLEFGLLLLVEAGAKLPVEVVDIA
jgi:hypothetical protein